MQISPKVAIWVNVVLALLTLLSSGGLNLAGIVSPGTAAQIVTWSGAGIVVINGVMHAFASSTPGPLAPPDAPSVVKAQAVADLTPSDPLSKVKAVKAAAIEAVESRDPKAGGA